MGGTRAARGPVAESGVALTVTGMLDALGPYLVVLLNGLSSLVGLGRSPVAVSAVLLVAGALWFALLEIDELTRRSTRPDVQRH